MTEIKKPKFEKVRNKKAQIRRDLISFFLISIVMISTVAFFSYQDEIGAIQYSSDIPTVNIEIAGAISNSTQQCFVKISPDTNEFSQETWPDRFLAASIRMRDSDGGYSFELQRGENLLSIRNDDDWLLLPSGKNLDALRTKLSFDIYNLLGDDNPNIKLPESKFVELYINDVYQDLYLLSERVDRKSLNLAEENEESPSDNDLLFKVSNWDGDFYTIPNNVDYTWEQLYPNNLIFSEIPIDLVEFVLNSTEEDFFDDITGIFSKFNKNSLIDNLLFGLLTGHEIIEGSSFYLVYDKDSAKYNLLPWNFEQSWGFNNHGTVDSDLWFDLDKNGIESVLWSNLYHRLLFPENIAIKDEILTDITDRWSEIRNEVWNPTFIIDSLDELYFSAQNSFLRSGISNEFVIASINRIKEWISTRFDILDLIFEENNEVFSDNFELPFPENSSVFGFSDPAARRYYYKSSVLFTQDRIHNVNITIREESLSNIISRKLDRNPTTNHIWMASDISIDGYSMDNVAFRIKANLGSLNTPKNSFKLKFFEEELFYYESYRLQSQYFPENIDRRFLGLKNINLRAGPGDLSLLNEPVGHEIFKITGNPYLRVSWAKLYITLTDESGNVVQPQEYKGLYWFTEQIDKTYLRTRFKNPDGNLYKTTGAMAILNDWYLTSNPDDLKMNGVVETGRRTYELKTNEEIDDYTDLRDFIYTVNYNWENIEGTTDLGILSRFFAADNYQGAWDDYIFIGHNYYLYSDPNAGFIMLPWDIENNLNKFDYWIGNFDDAPLLDGYTGTFNWVNWAAWFGNWDWQPRERPLWDNAIDDPAFVSEFLSNFEKIANNTQYLLDKVEQWSNLIIETQLLVYNATSQNDLRDAYGTQQPYSNEITYYSFLSEKLRVTNFLTDRKEYVEEQLVILL